MSQGAQRRGWKLEAQFFSELAGGRIGRILARFDQSCRKLPKHAVVVGRQRTKRTRRTHRRPQVDMTPSVARREMSEDNDGIERFARADVVRERSTRRSVGELKSEIEPPDVEEPSTRSGMGGPIGDDRETKGGRGR
jgi:hypothetical protein